MIDTNYLFLNTFSKVISFIIGNFLFQLHLQYLQIQNLITDFLSFMEISLCSASWESQ